MVIVHEEFSESVPTNCMIEGLESKEMFNLCVKLSYTGPITPSAQFAVQYHPYLGINGLRILQSRSTWTKRKRRSKMDSFEPKIIIDLLFSMKHLNSIINATK